MKGQTTGQVPISRDGDARIRDNSFDVPPTCLSPVILVNPNGIANYGLFLSMNHSVNSRQRPSGANRIRKQLS